MTQAECHQLLGTEPGCSAEDLKNAYRKKALFWHPDKNSAPEANDMFIAVAEAHAYLQEVLLRSETTNSIFLDYDVWRKTEHYQIRQQIKEQLKMSYREFLVFQRSEGIKATECILTHLVFLISFTSVVLLPIVCTIYFGWTGFFMSIFWNILTILVTSSAVRNLNQLSVKSLVRALRQIITK